MTEYIEREAVHNLVRSITKYTWTSPIRNEQRITVDADDIQFGVDKIPAADVAPVRHGWWYDKGSLSCRCSECGCKSNRESNYCPNCGALMKEAEHEAG